MSAASEPRTFGRYQLLRKLATGGMAQIWLARQTGIQGFEKLVVVKKILPHLGENDEFVQMFLDEARIAARLSHPNIVAIHDLGHVDDEYFIAMEYIHGEDARRVWKQSEAKGRPLPIALACRIVAGAAEGLHYAHMKTDDAGRPLGIVHRDVSPQNILVSFDGGVKVVDFGIAKAADQATHTKSGVLKGKYSYMSPEQAQGLKLDHRSDVFALGVVLWELLTGTRLFKRANEILTLNAVTECRVDPPSLLRPEIPPELDAVCLKALARELDARYPDARALQIALDDVLVKRQLPSSSTHLSQYLREIYADRLAEESMQGAPVLPDESSRASRSVRIGGAEPVAEREDRSVKVKSPLARSTEGDPGGTVALTVSGKPKPIDEPEPPTLPPSPPPPPPTLPPPREAGRSSRVPLDNPTERLQPLKHVPPESTRGPGAAEPSRVRTSSRVRVVPPPQPPAATPPPPGRSEPEEHTPVEAHKPRSVLPLFALVAVVVAAGAAFLFRDRLLPAPPPPAPPVVAALPATLAVDTDPAGATVTVNGVRWAQVTPTVVELPAGQPTQIGLALEGYDPMELPVGPLGAAQVATLGKARLQRTREPIAELPDAGEAPPATSPEAPPDPTVAAPKQGGSGTLVVTSDVAGLVFVDGRRLGRTGEPLKVAAGRHAVKVAAQFNGATITRPVSAEVKAGERTDRAVAFGVGSVLFLVTPRGAGADVFFDGVKIASLPGEAIRFPAGDHTFTVKNEELGFSERRTVQVAAGEVTKVSLIVRAP